MHRLQNSKIQNTKPRQLTVVAANSASPYPFFYQQYSAEATVGSTEEAVCRIVDRVWSQGVSDDVPACFQSSDASGGSFLRPSSPS